MLMSLMHVHLVLHLASQLMCGHVHHSCGFTTVMAWVCVGIAVVFAYVLIQYLLTLQEHCLLGIRGNVKRNTDGHLIHTNCDTDVIVSEEPPLGSTEKPEEMYHIIERFCNVSAGFCTPLY